MLLEFGSVTGDDAGGVSIQKRCLQTENRAALVPFFVLKKLLFIKIFMLNCNGFIVFLKEVTRIFRVSQCYPWEQLCGC